MSIHEKAAALLRAAQEKYGPNLRPDLEQHVQFYAGAAVLYARAAHHLVRALGGKP